MDGNTGAVLYFVVVNKNIASFLTKKTDYSKSLLQIYVKIQIKILSNLDVCLNYRKTFAETT